MPLKTRRLIPAGFFDSLMPRLAALIRRLSVGLLTSYAYLSACQATARFHHLTMEDGLSNNEVLSAIQDRNGYLWFATGDGLDRYDGYSFKVYKHDPSDPRSLSGSFVRTVFEDPQGRLWVGTFSDGLDLYDPKTESFKHYRHIPGDPDSLLSDNIWSLAAASDGSLLVGTRDAGLDILDTATGKFRHHPPGSGPDSPSGNRIQDVFVDSQKHIWLATSGGLDEFSADGAHRLKHFNSPDSHDKNSNNFTGVAEDREHRLWLTTLSGVYLYNPGDAAVSAIPGVSAKGDKLAGVSCYGIYIDTQQNIWFDSQQNGLYLIRAGTHQVLNYQHQTGNSDSLTSNNTYWIFGDRAGYLWVASYIGLNIIDPASLDVYSLRPSDVAGNEPGVGDSVDALTQYQHKLLIGGNNAIYQFSLSSTDDRLKDKGNVFMRLDTQRWGSAKAITVNGAQHLLLGTERGYLIEVDSRGQPLKTWQPGHDLGISPNFHRIVSTAGSNVYLGTFYHGLLEFDLKTSKTKRIAGNNPSELEPGDIVEDLLQTSPTELWAGTFRGLFRVNTQTGSSALVPMLSGGAEPVIQGLYEDAERNIWVASYDGLWRLRLDPSGDLASVPEQIPQFKRMQLLAIEPDTEGRLWIASANAIFRFQPSTGELLTYGRNQGSPMSEYYSYGHTRTSNGWLWFAGGQGVVGFQPERLNRNKVPPEVILNGVTSYENGNPSYTGLQLASGLTLSYRDTISIFDVSATDYGAPQANSYSYRLLGFQSEWTPPSTSHDITFTNLNPGRYRLEVRAANNWGTWSVKPASLDIVVMPPWWRTWWAYTLYLLLVIGSSIGYVYSLKRKIEREKQVSASLREANEIKANFVEKLQTQVAAATRELRETLLGVNLKNAELEIAQKRAAEGEQVKSQFLAHMSHELRTPLTGILGFTKLLGSTSLNSEQKDYIGTIHQSSETLLAIINDTLDLSKLDAGKLLIDEVDFDLLEVIESTLELLAPTAYQKRLELVRVIPPDVPLQLRGDPLRLRQILTNLLSNAIKFTESGAVAIQVGVVSEDEREAALAITVSDTGIGISEIELPQLFHAYARSRISTRQHVEGTGLGLAICKKLLDLMGGTIQVRSRVGSGTSFEFKLVFKLQKNAQPRVKLPKKLHIALYDKHPLSSSAWRASLTRLGAEVREVMDLEMLLGMEVDAAVLSLSERELAHLGELKQKFSPALPPMLILAPRIERQVLKDLSEALYHRVVSKSAREKTVYLELQSLVQAAIQTDPGASTAKKPARVTPASDAPYVLVADDNRINRRLLVTMLTHAGFRTGEAGNGHELLDLAARGPWDAALLDIHMPGMDGIETATRLRAVYGESVPPIIAMSADVMPETRNQMQQGIMDDFIMKPFSEQELVDKLRWHLDRHVRKRRDGAQSV